MNKIALAIVVMLSIATTTVSTFSFAQNSVPPPAVPVAQPKLIEKTEKKEPPEVTSKDPKEQQPKEAPKDDNLLPGRFIKNILESMPPNSAGYVTVQAMRVDTNRRCWLYPYQIYTKKDEKNIVLVTKDETGSFHVVLESVSHQWDAVDFNTQGWLSVKTVRDSKKVE